MEKLGQLRASDEWDLIVVDTPPSRSALDFLDAPNRLGRFLDGTMIRLLTAPARAGGRAGLQGGQRRLRGVQPDHHQDPRRPAAAATSPRSSRALDTMFGGFRERADGHLRAAAAAGHLVRRRRRAGAGRAARGLLLRRPALGRGRCRWPAWCSTARTRRRRRRCRPPAPRRPPRRWPSPAAKGAKLAAGALRVHAERMALATREQRLADRFTSAHPEVAVPHGPGRGRRRARPGRAAGHGRGADRPGRGHADRHAAHPGAPRAPRLTGAAVQLRARTLGGDVGELAHAGAAARQARRDVVLAGALAAGLVLPWVGGLGLAARNSADLSTRCPSELTINPPAGNTRVLAADGSLITEFYTNNRTR